MLGSKLSPHRSGVTDMRPGARTDPADSSPTHWTALENVKKGENLVLLTVFSYVLHYLL